MRRLLALLTLGAINCWFVLPLLASKTQTQLPACCRAHGKHHCALYTGVTPGQGFAPAPCAQFPAASSCASLSYTVTLTASQLIARRGPERLTVTPRPESLLRLSFSRSRSKRGPPFAV